MNESLFSRCEMKSCVFEELSFILGNKTIFTWMKCVWCFSFVKWNRFILSEEWRGSGNFPWVLINMSDMNLLAGTFVVALDSAILSWRRNLSPGRETRLVSANNCGCGCILLSPSMILG